MDLRVLASDIKFLSTTGDLSRRYRIGAGLTQVTAARNISGTRSEKGVGSVVAH